MSEQLETFPQEDRSRALDIIHMQDKHGATARTHQKRVAEVDIHFCHEKGGQQLREVPGTIGQLDDHEFAGAVRNIVFAKKLLGAVGITDDDSTDRGLIGFGNAEGENDDVVLIKQAHNFEKRTDLVLKKNGKLTHLWTIQLFGGGCSGHGEITCKNIPYMCRLCHLPS